MNVGVDVLVGIGVRVSVGVGVGVSVGTGVGVDGRLKVWFRSMRRRRQRLFDRGLDGCADVNSGFGRRLRACDQEERDSDEKGCSHEFECRFLPQNSSYKRSGTS